MPLCRWAVFALLLAVAAPAWAAQDDAAPAETVPEWPKLNRYATTDQHWSANAYWLESQTGNLLIDALFLRSDVEAMAAAIKSRGKPLAGILLTHPHLDHFGGIAALRRIFGDVPVYATRDTADAVLPPSAARPPRNRSKNTATTSRTKPSCRTGSSKRKRRSSWGE